MQRSDSLRLLLALGLAAQSLGGGAQAQAVPARQSAGSPEAPLTAVPKLPQLQQIAQAPLSVPMPVAPEAAPARPARTDLPPAVPAAEPPAVAAPADTAVGRAQTRQVTLTLRQLGALGPLSLRGTSELQGVQFGIRSDEVVTAANLSLSGAMSPSLLAQLSNVTVTLNEQYVGTVPVQDGKPRFDNLEMPVSPVFFGTDNRLNFRFTGRYTDQCSDPLSGLLWSTISDTSTLTLTLVRLPPQRDLARLPLPFFDANERQRLTLPFVTGTNPGNEMLQAAGIVSSWFGKLADFRGSSHPVSFAAPASGNAVVFATERSVPADVTLPPITGPMLAVLPNPNDASGSLLLVAGRTDAELAAAAQALVLGGGTLGGAQAGVEAPRLAARKPYDAPTWIPTNRPVTFGELVDAGKLQASGYAPGALRVPFRTAPDLYTWRNQGFPMEIRYHAPPGPIIDLASSRLDVGVNGLYLASLPLAEDRTRAYAWLPGFLDRSEVRQALNAGDTTTMRRVDMPVYSVFGRNELQLTFDSRPLSRGCAGMPADLRMAVDPDSTIDMSRAIRLASLPNLGFFVNSGFPFSRMADLSETAVVVPHRPDAREIQTYLDLLARIGAQTGYPAVGVAVVRPEEVARVADRDLLLVGTLDRLQGAADLLRNSPFRMDGDRLGVSVGSALGSVRRLVGFGGEDRVRPAQAALQVASSEALAAIVGSESPLSRGRSLVAVLGGGSETLASIVPSLQDSEQAARIQGDLAVLTGSRPTSYQVGDTYTVGRPPLWLYPAWLLRASPLGLLITLLAATALLAVGCFRALRRRQSNRLRQAET